MLVKFEVLFGPEGTDFTKIDENSNSIRFSDGEAQLPQLTLSGTFLDVIANEAGIKSGKTGVLVWTVRSFCGLDETLATVQGKLNVTRP